MERLASVWPLEVEIVLVGDDLVSEAETLIAKCESCEKFADLPFDYVLDALTDCDPQSAAYLMSRPATCPSCGGIVTEKTRIITC